VSALDDMLPVLEDGLVVRINSFTSHDEAREFVRTRVA
jgi:hypothetical protein